MNNDRYEIVAFPARFFEALDPEQPGEFGSFTLSEQEIIAFASDYDPRPIHIDAEAASKTMFGGLIASTLQTLSALFRVFARSTSELEFVTGLKMLPIESPVPVRPKERLFVRGRWMERRVSKSGAGQGIVILRARQSKGLETWRSGSERS